jgi:hypothetical protein
MVIAADGGNERELAHPTDVSLINVRWSPDGKTIGAYAQLRTNFAAAQWILGFDAATGARRTLYAPPRGRLLGGWAWAGPDVLVVSEATTQSSSGGILVRRVPLDGKPSTLLALRQPSGWLDVLGDDGLLIDQAMRPQNLGEWSLVDGRAVGADPNSAAPSRWLTRGGSVDRQPVYSRDGARVLFNSDRGGNLDLWEMELASGTLHRVTVGEGDDWDPAYTADGNSVLLSSNRGGNFEVWTGGSDGSSFRQVSHDGVDAENPTQTADGKWIVYASANTAKRGLWKVHPDGSGAVQILEGGIAIPEVSPDGAWVSYVDAERNLLRVATVEDGRPFMDIPLPPAFAALLQVGRSRWIAGPVPRLLWLAYDAGSNRWRLLAQDVAAGRDTSASRHLVVEGTADGVPESFAVSPDGSRLVISVGQPRSELLQVQGLHGLRH